MEVLNSKWGGEKSFLNRGSGWKSSVCESVFLWGLKRTLITAKRAWQSLVSWRICEGLNVTLSTVVYHVWVLLCCTLGELDWVPNSECYRSICLGCPSLHQSGPACVLFSILKQARKVWKTPVSGTPSDSEYPRMGQGVYKRLPFLPIFSSIMNIWQ